MLTIPILSALSKRQEEILQAACEGLPDKLIADRLGVSPRTLEGHWRAIHHKLGSVMRGSGASNANGYAIAVPAIMRSAASRGKVHGRVFSVAAARENRGLPGAWPKGRPSRVRRR